MSIRTTEIEFQNSFFFGDNMFFMNIKLVLLFTVGVKEFCWYVSGGIKSRKLEYLNALCTVSVR